MSFLHGVSVAYVDNVPRPVRTIDSAVIFLVGSAPTYKVTAANVTINDPKLCTSDLDDAAFFGAKTEGFTIPYALDVLRDYGTGKIEVVNVWNPAIHKTTASAVTFTFGTTGTLLNKIQLKRVTGTVGSQVATAINAEGLTGTFTVTNTAGSTTYTINTDYTYDAVTGVLTRVTGGTITSGQAVKVTYTYADPGAVTASDIIGAVVSGDRTGLQAALDVYPKSGHYPTILIAPWFSEQAAVQTELVSMANKVLAYTAIDAPANTTRDEAIAGRAGTAPVAAFGTSSRRAAPCLPRAKNSDGVMIPASVHWAGVVAYTDANFGYEWSPSNKPLQNVVELETKFSSDYTDINSDINLLNNAGIWTIYNGFGTGFLAWGNYSAAYPTDSSPLSFFSVGRTLDIFHRSLQLALLPFVDRPINDALIDALVATGNSFVNEQIGDGKLIRGSELQYDASKNLPSQLAQGIIKLSAKVMIPTPAQTIEIETTLDINLFTVLGTEG